MLGDISFENSDIEILQPEDKLIYLVGGESVDICDVSTGWVGVTHSIECVLVIEESLRSTSITLSPLSIPTSPMIRSPHTTQLVRELSSSLQEIWSECIVFLSSSGVTLFLSSDQSSNQLIAKLTRNRIGYT